MQIRPCRHDEAPALHAVFHSAVHELAAGYYATTELEAWAPRDFDQSEWAGRIRRLQPFVVDIGGTLIAYADLQPSGLIDHFFVQASHARQGIGSALMRHLEAAAVEQGLDELFADVSLAAELFFERHGFRIEERRVADVRGVPMLNARMRKRLPAPVPSASLPGDNAPSRSRP